METLKRFNLLDAKKVLEERISKKGQQRILGGYGGYDQFHPPTDQHGIYCWVYGDNGWHGPQIGSLWCLATTDVLECERRCNDHYSYVDGRCYCSTV